MRRVLGLVLAGGASRRFGSDKAMADLGGRPLIAHAMATLSPHVETMVLAGRCYLGADFLPDRPAPGLGPLGGLNAGLHHASAHGYDAVLSLACDTPLVPGEALDRLAVMTVPCAVSEHPVIGIWPAALGPLLDRFLQDDARRSMRGWMNACGAETLSVAGIANINRPSDLAAFC